MSVPLDNLYYWVESLLLNPAILYVFQPHGSKKISDCDWLKKYDLTTRTQFPAVVLHDQEPLDWDFYNCPEQYLERFYNYYAHSDGLRLNDLVLKHFSNFNLQSLTLVFNSIIYDRCILVHSEKNSKDLTQYQQNGFECVHYWAHAIIARDWYRFAQIDARLNVVTQPQSKFLIYCRDWSHRREYRLKFLEMLVENGIDKISRTSVMHTNSDNVHFSQYKFENPAFKLSDPEKIFQMPTNKCSSTESANYDPNDFVETQISVVLETVFDDSRIHLTEKTLRPIACGHPFILVAGPGALEYVKSYGFKTFAPWIDESYDLETDSLKRMEKIIQVMNTIKNLQGQQLEEFFRAIKEISDFNQKHFFSDEFFDIVRNELKNNLNLAYQRVKITRGRHYLDFLRLIKKHKLKFPKEEKLHRTCFLKQLRRSYPYDRSSPPEDPLV